MSSLLCLVHSMTLLNVPIVSRPMLLSMAHVQTHVLEAGMRECC